MSYSNKVRVYDSSLPSIEAWNTLFKYLIVVTFYVDVVF